MLLLVALHCHAIRLSAAPTQAWTTLTLGVRPRNPSWRISASVASTPTNATAGGLQDTLMRLRQDFGRGYALGNKLLTQDAAVASSGRDGMSIISTIGPCFLSVLLVEAAQFSATFVLCWLLCAPPAGRQRWLFATTSAVATRSRSRALRLLLEIGAFAWFKRTLAKAGDQSEYIKDVALRILAVAITVLVFLRALDRSLFASLNAPPAVGLWHALETLVPSVCPCLTSVWVAAAPATNGFLQLSAGGPLRCIFDAADFEAQGAAALRLVWKGLRRMQALFFR